MRLYHGAGWCRNAAGDPVVFPLLSLAADLDHAEQGMEEAALRDYPVARGYAHHAVIAAELPAQLVLSLAEEWGGELPS